MKKKYIWFFEIVVWLLIISVSTFFVIYNSTIKAKTGNMYYLFFDDVEGLVKGSPVRLMGMNIGYVRDVKIFENKVFVSFLVTEENVTIPNRASATIEFYGLGGSTSLELSTKTSTEVQNEEAIVTAKSYRVQDFWDGQALVSNVLIDIYGAFGRNVHPSDVPTLKNWAKQSSLVETISNQTGSINTAQSVMIYKMTEDTFDYSKKKFEKQEVQTNE